VTETGLIIGQVVFLLLLYLFIASVVRASTRALRTAEIEATPQASAPRAAATPGAAAATMVGVSAVKAPTARPTPVSPEAARAAAAAEPFLLVTRSSSLPEGTSYDVAGGATIGRSKSSRIPVTDQFISHTHARVFRRGHFWFVEDLGSLNGTFVNGQRISGEQQLHLRDEVRVGETTLRWEE